MYYLLLKIEIFRCYVSLPEGIPKELLSPRPLDIPPSYTGDVWRPTKKKPNQGFQGLAALRDAVATLRCGSFRKGG